MRARRFAAARAQLAGYLATCPQPDSEHPVARAAALESKAADPADDPLSAARGILLGTMISLFLWGLIVLGVAYWNNG